MIDFTRVHQPPRKYTFEMPEVKEWVIKWCKGNILNLFAGKTVLNLKEIRVDKDPRLLLIDYDMDVVDFANHWINGRNNPDADIYYPKFDTVIIDPPYNWRKAKEKYGGRYIGQYPILKDKLLEIITNDARVISFGYSSVGMSHIRGFKEIAILLVCHGGDHNDTIGLVEERIVKKRLSEVF